MEKEKKAKEHKYHIDTEVAQSAFSEQYQFYMRVDDRQFGYIGEDKDEVEKMRDKMEQMLVDHVQGNADFTESDIDGLHFVGTYNN